MGAHLTFDSCLLPRILFLPHIYLLYGYIDIQLGRSKPAHESDTRPQIRTSFLAVSSSTALPLSTHRSINIFFFWPLFISFSSQKNTVILCTHSSESLRSFHTANTLIMRTSATYMALAAASPALSAYVGFNYGSTFTTGAVKVQSDFESEFKTAQGLVSAPEVFSSARLYTTIVSPGILFYVLTRTLTRIPHSSKAVLPTLPSRLSQPLLAQKPPCSLDYGPRVVMTTSPTSSPP